MLLYHIYHSTKPSRKKTMAVGYGGKQVLRVVKDKEVHRDSRMLVVGGFTGLLDAT
jgi:hypothetical protein